MNITRKEFIKFIRDNKNLKSKITEGFNVSGIQYFNDKGDLLVGALYEKIDGIVSSSYHLNEV